LGQALMTPTRIYVRSMLALHRAGLLKAAAHITGGGLPGNLPRVLPPDIDAVVEWDSWEVPRIFDEIQAAGGVSDTEMARVFNLGVGMVVAVPPSAAEATFQVLADAGQPASVIGTLVPGQGSVRLHGR
jgi:phosphoribosylformylglycinamidine cyclo-ligase